MESITLRRDTWGNYKAQKDIDKNSPLITIALLAEDMGVFLYSYIDLLKNGENGDTEQCYSRIKNNFFILTDRFAEEDEILIQLTITRENLIQVLKKWEDLDNQKVNEIILTHHDDGTVTIEGR